MEMEMNMAGTDAVRGRLGVLGLLAGALVKPRDTMVALRKVRRSWWGIPALLTLAVIILSVIAYSYADCQYVHQLEMDQYLSSTNSSGRPPEPPTPLPITMTIRAAGRLISTCVAWFAWSGAVYLALLLLGHSAVDFGSVWTLAIWAWMPYAVRDIIQSIYMIAIHRPVYNQGLSGLVVDRTPPPPMTFRYLIPTTSELALASLLERLDIYMIWHLALMVLGTRALTKLSRRKAIGAIWGIWLVLTLVALIPGFFPRTFARFRFF